MRENYSVKRMPLFLNIPRWSSDRDPQKSSNVSTLRFSLSFRVISRMFLSVFTFRTQRYFRLCEALAGLMPFINAWTGEIMKALIGTIWKPANFRLYEALFGLLVSIASSSVAYIGNESSRWLLHAVYLLHASWGLNFLYSGSREIEIFRTRPWAFIRLNLYSSR